MKPTKDDKQQGHANWLQSLSQGRNRCRQALMQASVDVSDPYRALWPAVPRGAMNREHQTVAQAHAAVLDYAEHIEPFKNRCAGVWTVEIVEPHEFPDGETLDVTLSDIEDWADRRYELESRDTHELTGRSKTTEYRRVHLPTKYSRECYRKLNKCLEQLNLAAELKTPERTVNDAEEAW